MKIRRNGNGHHDRKLEKLVDLYLLRCEVEGKSPNTVVAYGETLRLFQRIAEEEGIPADGRAITPAHIYTYLGRIAETGVSLETRHRRHREVRFFFGWLERMEYIAESPFARIKNMRLPHKIVQPYSTEEVRRLLSVCDQQRELGARDGAIVLLLLDCGLRLNELVELEAGERGLRGPADSGAVWQGEQAAGSAVRGAGEGGGLALCGAVPRW